MVELVRKRNPLKLVVVLLVVAACAGGLVWVWLTPKPPSIKWNAARSSLHRVDKAIHEYADANHGEYPESLESLVPEFLEGWALSDPYSHEFYHYERTAEGYLLRCNGADNQAGGIEIPDKDIVFTELGEQ